MKGRQLLRKWGLAVPAVLLAMVPVLGCSSEGKDNPGQGGAAEGTSSKDPLTLTMMLNFDGKEFPKPGNEVQTMLEKLTNTKLQIEPLPGTAYSEKLPVMVASGDLPKVVASFGSLKQSYLVDGIEGDVFWEIGPLLKNYPKLSQINKISYDNTSINGKTYGLPRVRPLARGAFIYRADWVKNVGLKEPKTIDEYYAMLKAFKEKDPDQNGKADTYGMTVSSVGNFGIFFGAPNGWEQRNGKFVNAVLTDEYLQGLKFEKRLYDEGLINKDFAAIDRPKWEGEYEFGKAGVILNTSNTIIAFGERAKKQSPKAETDFFSRLTGPKGEKVKGETGANGILLFPKSSIKTEAELKRVLQFFEQLNDEKVATLLEWGIEGKHYEMKNGKAVRTNQEAFDNDVGFPYKLPIGVVPSDKYAVQGELHPMAVKEKQVTTENEKFAVNDPTLALISPTAVEKGAQLDLIIKDANTKFVMGALDEEGWKKEIDRWRKNGGDKMAEEYADKFAKQQKK